MTNTFFSKLLNSIDRKESLLCVGLDPQMDIASKDEVVPVIFEFCKNIIEQTLPFTACYKPNIAFFEQFGAEGIEALKKTLSLIPEDTPVILDAKRGDIGNTARAYARSVFGDYCVDAVTLSPYLGRESIDPFLEYKGKGLFILCRTSNPGADAFQNLTIMDNTGDLTPFYINLAREVSSWSPEIGLVVAGNNPGALKAVRRELPSVWFLAPGIGAQGGSSEEAIRCGMGKDGHNILVNVSREVANASSPEKKARELRDSINAIRKKITYTPPEKPVNRKKALIRDIINEGCFKIGSFKLKSGKISPFYIDLRKLISNPGLLSRVAGAYTSLVKNLSFDRIAGLPLAAVATSTCISLQTGKPQIFPRLQKKEHGTGNTIEGTYNTGETIVMIDDLITTGKSKIEALEILKAEGLEVKDLVVLVERGKQGRKDMDEAGINLHSYLKLEDFLEVCLEMGQIDKAQLEELRRFAEED